MRCFTAILFLGIYSSLHGQEVSSEYSKILAIVEKVKELKSLPSTYGKSGTSVRDAALKRQFYQLKPENYEALIRAIGENDHSEFNHLLLSGWIQHDPHAALVFLKEKRKGWENYTSTYHLFERLAAEDPELALREAQSLEKNGVDLTFAALRVIAADSPERALELIPTEGREASIFTTEVLNFWSAREPEKILPWIMKRPKRARLLMSLGTIWAVNDRPAAEAWASSISGDDQIFARLGIVKEHLEARQGKLGSALNAAQEFMEFFPTQSLASNTPVEKGVFSLAQHIGESLPSGGEAMTKLKWIERFEQNTEREVLVDHLLEGWLRYDPWGAFRLIQEMPEGDRRDRWTSRFLLKGNQLISEEDFKTAHTIRHDQIRASALVGLFPRCFLEDPELAYRTMKALSEADQEEVKKRLKRRAAQQRMEKFGK